MLGQLGIARRLACGHRKCQLLRRCFADTDGYGNTNSHGDGNYYSYRNSDTDGHGYGYCNCNPDSYSHGYCYCYGNSQRDSDSDTAPDRNTKGFAITKDPTNSSSETLNPGNRLLLKGVIGFCYAMNDVGVTFLTVNVYLNNQ